VNNKKRLPFFKIGAWILLLAGFGHTAISIVDIFRPGMFSPSSKEIIASLREVSLHIVEVTHGSGTSLLESAWGAYIGFSISVGLLLGFFGLILLLSAKNDGESRILLKKLVPASTVMVAVMVAVSSIFFYYLPTALIACSLICFIFAWFNLSKGEFHAA
jgi:hypothetical protein